MPTFKLVFLQEPYSLLNSYLAVYDILASYYAYHAIAYSLICLQISSISVGSYVTLS